jgi:hypothetical protein
VGKTGSSRRIVKLARMTPMRHRALNQQQPDNSEN